MKKLLLSSFMFLALSAGLAAAAPAYTFADTPTVQEELIQEAACQEGDNTQCVDDCVDPASPGAGTSADPVCVIPEPCPQGVNQDCDFVNKYVNPAIQLIGVLTGVAVVIGIIYGGIQYAASGGDPQKAATARHHIRNAIIALLLYFILYAFIKFMVPGTGLVVD